PWLPRAPGRATRSVDPRQDGYSLGWELVVAARTGSPKEDAPEVTPAQDYRRILLMHDATGTGRRRTRDGHEALSCGPDHARSKRSKFITLFQAATKSRTNFCCASELP